MELRTLVSERDAGAGTNSWIVVDSWDGEMGWIGTGLGQNTSPGPEGLSAS